MTRQQKLLAKIRAWIDRRLPRDVLRVTILDSATGAVLLSTTHIESILHVKMTGLPNSCLIHEPATVVFTTEHLTP